MRLERAGSVAVAVSGVGSHQEYARKKEISHSISISISLSLCEAMTEIVNESYLGGKTEKFRTERTVELSGIWRKLCAKAKAEAKDLLLLCSSADKSKK